jgi:exopolyphosphatase / guanosine-5'-triphosphate,3'-diphosphate pyrophosphatase
MAAESMFMGCVSHSMRFFPDGVIDELRFEAAFIAARLEMEPHKKLFRSLGWDRALGSSGTILAVDQVLRAQGWSHGIDEKGVKRLRRAMVELGHVDRLAAQLGVPADRAAVFPGGVAILDGVMRSLRLEALEATSGSIREGVLVDLLGRNSPHDAREATVADLARRWGIDTLQAARVERTARFLLEGTNGRWVPHDADLAWLLQRAARLHELGLSVAHSGYHRHGGYLLANADLPGFSRQDQLVLAALVRSHRRRLRPEYFAELPPSLRKLLPRYAALLRLSVRLHRGRSDRALPGLRASVPKARKPTLRLAFPAGWLAEHPLTAADLAREQGYMAEAGMILELEG